MNTSLNDDALPPMRGIAPDAPPIAPTLDADILTVSIDQTLISMTKKMALGLVGQIIAQLQVME
jgi:hypothetical protein